MAKGIRICKVCGEPYEYCHTTAPEGVNRWQDVACCIEHATEYFRQIAISRGELVEEESKPSVTVEEPIVEDHFTEIVDLFGEDEEESEEHFEEDSDDEE